MSLTWVILGSLFQLGLAGFLFMLVVFSAGGIANSGTATRLQMGILTLSAYLLPFLCLLSAGLVIHSYRAGGDAQAYWWYAMPVAAAVGYVIYAVSFE